MAPTVTNTAKVKTMQAQVITSVKPLENVFAVEVGTILPLVSLIVCHKMAIGMVISRARKMEHVSVDKGGMGNQGATSIVLQTRVPVSPSTFVPEMELASVLMAGWGSSAIQQPCQSRKHLQSLL